MAIGEDFECEQSYELMTALLYMDERVAAPLAKRIEQIRSVDQAYKLDALIREAREQRGAAWALSPQDVAPFVDVRGPGVDEEASPPVESVLGYSNQFAVRSQESSEPLEARR